MIQHQHNHRHDHQDRQAGTKTRINAISEEKIVIEIRKV
jgi:hypothetical protein